MITTDLNRAEFTGNNSSTEYVFASSGTNIPVKDASHIKVYLTNTGTFTADASNETFTNVTLNGSSNTSHGHINGEVIRVSAATSLPTGLLANTDYYIREKQATTWKLETAVGAGVSAITTNGEGTLTWNKTLLKAITTDYTVTISGTTATVKFLVAPPTNVKILLLREVPFQQNTDLLNNSLIDAESLESQLDLIVNQVQQLKNTTERDIRFSDTLLASDATETQAVLNVTASDRANKGLKFDASGNATVSSIDLDKAEDYILESKSYATETGAVVNTYDGGTASPQSGVYSAKEYAVGSATPSAKDYATKTSAAVTGSEFSAKEYAQGSQSSTGGSSKNWASQTGADVTGGSSGDKSAKSWAQETGANAPSAGSAKEWATETSAAVDTTFSAKEYAQGSQSGTGGSAKNWASQTGADVTGGSTGDMSSKEWAIGTLGRGVASEGSAKDWATYTAGTVDDSGYSAKYHATDASNSATAAKNSAASVSNVFDSFDDTYLGRMADSDSQGTNPTTNGTWAKNSSTITVASGSNIKVGQVVTGPTGKGIPTSPKPNVLSIDGTTVVISDAFTSAQTNIALTFTGYGVYGDYNTSKDGPALDNDGDALVTGSLYFNSTDNEMRILDSGGNWIAATSAGDVSLLEYKFVTTSSQVTSKTYSGTADVGGTLSYTQDNLIVFMNGVQLKNGVDYTATNGSSIVLTTAGQLLDEINVLAFKSFTTADMVSKSNGGTFASAVTFGAGLTSTTGTFSGTITANGGIETSTTTKVKQKGAFMQSSTHQAWVMGG